MLYLPQIFLSLQVVEAQVGNLALELVDFCIILPTILD
jgi:hypothetical protein